MSYRDAVPRFKHFNAKSTHLFKWMLKSVFMSSCVNATCVLSLFLQHYYNLIHELYLLNVHRPRSSRHHVEQACQGEDHQEAPSEGHLQRLRHVRPVSDPGVQRSVQHDRPEQGRIHRQGGSAWHAGLSRYTGLSSLHLQSWNYPD